MHYDITVGNLEREYYVYAPPAKSQMARPLVVMLHGGAGKPESAARMTGFSELAKQENFIVAYPYGTGRVSTWNAGKCCGYAMRNNVDDVAYIRAMLEEIKSNYRIDEQRIYAVGMSNGGMMAYKLACDMGDVFRAVAPVAGAMNTYTCEPQGRPSMAIFHAINDEHVLYNGGVSEKGLRSMFGLRPAPDASVEDAVQFWMKNDYCRPIPQTDRYDDYSVVNYFCAEEREVRIYMLNSGGHSWPGGEKGWAGADEPLQSISATQEIWKFFKQHPTMPLF